jgi:hypothetical protein
MKNLSVEQFGPVKKAELELRDVNLYIGEQSICKSTLAKLITILTDYISLCRLIIGGQLSWEDQLKAYNLHIYKDDKYKIIYNMEEKGVILHLEIRPGRLSSSMQKNGKKVTNKKSIMAELIRLKPIYHNELWLDAIKKDSENSEEGNNSNLMELMNNSLYIPAERIIYSVIDKLMPAIILAKSTVPLNLLKFMIDLGNAKGTYPQYDIPLLDISYSHESSEDYFVVKENKKKFPLTSASSGIQSALPLLLVLQYAVNNREYSSFVIEEPECNLFPEKQVELLRYILSIVKSDNRTLTITTHSPYLLSAMNNYLYAGTLVKEYGDNIRESVSKVLPESYQLKPGECSVYSLGECINGDGVYCKSLIDEETGMIDYNTLDGISAMMTDEFDQLEDTFIQMKRKL